MLYAYLSRSEVWYLLDFLGMQEASSSSDVAADSHLQQQLQTVTDIQPAAPLHSQASIQISHP